MEEKYYQSFCYSLAKAFSTGIRIYEDKECQYYYSVHHMYPDPVTPYLDSMMKMNIKPEYLRRRSISFMDFCGFRRTGSSFLDRPRY